MFLLSPIIFAWDLAIMLMIAGGLCMCIASIVWFTRNHRSARPAKLQRSGVGFLGFLGCFGFLTVAYGSFIEPHIIVTTRHTVSLPFAEPLTIAVIADIHVGPYKNARFLRRVVERVNAELPDLILIPGDFLYDQNSAIDELAPLANLRAPLGIYGVTGNHDAGRFLSVIINHHIPYTERDRSDEVSSYLQGKGITVLRNSSKILDLPHGRIAITGTDDVMSASHSMSGALASVPTDAPLILVAHSPDVILDPSSHRAQLIVVGHTHGGQIRLPLIGPVPPFPNRLGHRYDQGIFRIDDNTTLAITRGIGETLARARLFAWPEVMILKTRP